MSGIQYATVHIPAWDEERRPVPYEPPPPFPRLQERARVVRELAWTYVPSCMKHRTLQQWSSGWPRLFTVSELEGPWSLTKLLEVFGRRWLLAVVREVRDNHGPLERLVPFHGETVVSHPAVVTHRGWPKNTSREPTPYAWRAQLHHEVAQGLRAKYGLKGKALVAMANAVAYGWWDMSDVPESLPAAWKAELSVALLKGGGKKDDLKYRDHLIAMVENEARALGVMDRRQRGNYDEEAEYEIELGARYWERKGRPEVAAIIREGKHH